MTAEELYKREQGHNAYELVEVNNWEELHPTPHYVEWLESKVEAYKAAYDPYDR